MSIVYNRTIVTNGLVLCLDAANSRSYPGSGTTWTDLSGRGNNGTLYNGLGYSTNNSGHMVYDGVDDAAALLFPTNSNPFSSNFTVDVFFYMSQISRTNPLIRQDAATNAANTMFINYASFDQLQFRIIDSQQTGFGDIRGALLTNTWYHACMTVNFTTLELVSYVNAIPSTPISLSTYNGSELSRNYYIGDSRGPDIGTRSTLLGGISTTKVYNRALTASEIQQNYNALKGRFGL